MQDQQNTPLTQTTSKTQSAKQKQIDNKTKLKIKQQHFYFNRYQVILHVVFILANVVYAMFYMMPEQVRKYPPEDQRIKQSFLTPILGRKRDYHDAQWEAFRTNIPIMLITIFAWKYTVLFFAPKNKVFILMKSYWLGLGLLSFTYRGDIFLFLTVVLFWYYMTKILYKTKIITPLVWAIVILSLYINQKYDHLRFLSAWFEQYIPDSLSFFKNSNAPLLWTNILNMNFLKMISFTMDYHWGYNQNIQKDHKIKCESCKSGNLCYRGRDLYKIPQMNLTNYLDYILYAPTCLAGPPISYTNFHSFTQIKTHTNPPYLHITFLLIYFQLYQHFYPIIIPNKQQNLIQMSFCSLLFLYFIYLKFTIIWRIGRFWSLMYGIDTIQNMGRCMFNNYGFQKFWRMWHKGFNHWLIRYMYIPLGGNKNLISVLFVIIFVAFWHDHTIKIIFWALILVLFMIPQLAIKSYIRKHYNHLYPKFWFKYICAFGCSFYIQIICYCNLIGFGYGIQNAKFVIIRIQNQLWNFGYVTITLTSACILMFYIREIQKPQRND